MIAEGRYKARPISWGLSESKNGHEQFAIAFEIIEGEETGNTITWYGSFANDQATDITIAGIKACGWAGSDLTSVELPGTEVTIKVAHEEYQGQVRAKVKFIDAGGGGIKLMAGDKAKAFALKMANRIKAFDAKNGPPKPAPAAKPPNGTRKPPPAMREPGDDFDESF